jgi:predicted RNase H-like HicB family nuclease
MLMKFKVVLEEAEEGGYVVYVPSLPGCVSQGETKEEALENIKEAIEVYLDIDDAEIEAEIKCFPFNGFRFNIHRLGKATRSRMVV